MRTKVIQCLNRYQKTLRREKLDIFSQFLRGCCEAHRTEHSFYSLAEEFLDKNDWNGLLDLADVLSAQKYTDPEQHFSAHQFSLLIRKYPFSKDLVNRDPEKQATKNFLRSEQKCKRTNQKFRVMLSNWRNPPRFSRDYEYRLSRMASWIAYVLGDLDCNAIFDNCEFGPGASLGVSGNATNLARKLLAKQWTVTPEATTIALNAIGRHCQIRELILTDHDKNFYSADPELLKRRFYDRVSNVANNKIVFVPKTAKTHRAIAVEPLLNGFVQKGIDRCMRKRLLRVGIDLSDQSKNQVLAREGSVPDSVAYCTLDLSAASDSLSTEVVRRLLPYEWFDFLNSCRSTHGNINDSIVRYEKFCSMGNGFCFPLESLIFGSAVYEAGGNLGKDSLVYGDDIVVPPLIVNRVIENLSLLGFSLNIDKTFTSGPFRESCGGDYFDGEDVRPFTLDFEIDSLRSIFKIINLTKRNLRCEAYFTWLTLDFFKVPKQLQFVRPFQGPPDTAVTVQLDTFLGSPYCGFNRSTWTYRWRELLSDPVQDTEVALIKGYNIALVYGALQGASSVKPFTIRRKSRTKVKQMLGSGASSNWVPAPQRP